MDDVRRIERVISVKQREQSHQGAEAPVKLSHLCLGELFVKIDGQRSHDITPPKMAVVYDETAYSAA
jgi:hypothetical protein